MRQRRVEGARCDGKEHHGLSTSASWLARRRDMEVGSLILSVGTSAFGETPGGVLYEADAAELCYSGAACQLPY